MAQVCMFALGAVVSFCNSAREYRQRLLMADIASSFFESSPRTSHQSTPFASNQVTTRAIAALLPPKILQFKHPVNFKHQIAQVEGF